MPDGNLVVGLFGKMGCGKSTVAEILEEDFGFVVLEADRFGHQALEEEKDRILAEFGEQLLSEDGKIDRKLLGDIVFSDMERLSVLNSIVHPRIREDIKQIISKECGKKFVIDAALLFEIGLDEFCDFIISVEAPDKDIIRRVRKYRKWPSRKIKRVLGAQRYLELLKDKSHFIIFNNKGREKLHKQVEFFTLAIY